MLPIYFIIGLINVLAKTNNYGIKIDDPEMDIRVRRDIRDTDTSSKILQHLFKSYDDTLIREKRQFSFFLPKKTTNQVVTTPKYNYNNGYNNKYYHNGKLDYNFVTQNNGMLRKNERFTSNNVSGNYNNRNAWNTSNARQNNTNNGIYIQNNVTGIYGYRPNNVSVTNFTYTNRFPGNRPHPLRTTLMPKFNTTRFKQYNATGYNNQTPKYYETAQQIYNYQDPTKSNFSGYYEHMYSNSGNGTAGYNNATIKPYAPGYLPIPAFNPSNTTTHWYNNFNNTPVPYKPDYPPTTPQYVSTTQVVGKSGNNTVTTTTEISIACVICNIGCPANHHWVGFSCMPDDDNEDY